MIGIMQGRLSSPLSEKIQEFPWNSWKEEFASAQLLSVKLIEWTLDYFRMFENPIMDEENEKIVGKIIKEHGVSVTSITLDCFLEAPIHRSNPLTGLKSSITDLKAVVNSVSKVGVKLGVLPLVAESGQDDLATLRILISHLAELEEFCSQRQFKIALECEFPLPLIEFIAEEIEFIPHVGFNFDIGNGASLGNNPLEEIRVCGRKLFNVHIKDRKYLGKTVPLGQGDANFNLIAEELRRMNYDGNMILQVARKQTGQEIETIREYLDFCLKLGWR